MHKAGSGARGPTRMMRIELTRRGGREVPPSPQSAFARDLQRLDPDLELFLWEPGGIYCLYRVARRGAVRCDDVLQKELDVLGSDGSRREPGSWLIEWLRRNDVCKRYGTYDPERARKLYLHDIMAEEDRENERWRSKVDKVAHAFSEDAYFCARGRFSGALIGKEDPKVVLRQRREKAIERYKKEHGDPFELPKRVDRRIGRRADKSKR